MRQKITAVRCKNSFGELRNECIAFFQSACWLCAPRGAFHCHPKPPRRTSIHARRLPFSTYPGPRARKSQALWDRRCLKCTILMYSCTTGGGPRDSITFLRPCRTESRKHWILIPALSMATTTIGDCSLPSMRTAACPNTKSVKLARIWKKLARSGCLQRPRNKPVEFRRFATSICTAGGVLTTKEPRNEEERT